MTTLAIFILGALFTLAIQGAIKMWRFANSLPPKDGHTVVRKGGKRFYRKLPKPGPASLREQIRQHYSDPNNAGKPLIPPTQEVPHEQVAKNP